MLPLRPSVMLLSVSRLSRRNIPCCYLFSSMYPPCVFIPSFPLLPFGSETKQWEPEDMNEGQSNQILTCIVDGMRSDRPSPIRAAAARALINSLDFTRSNFESQQERDVIMQVCI